MNCKKLFTLALVLTTVGLSHHVRADGTWHVNYTRGNTAGDIIGTPCDQSVFRSGSPREPEQLRRVSRLRSGAGDHRLRRHSIHSRSQ